MKRLLLSALLIFSVSSIHAAEDSPIAAWEKQAAEGDAQAQYELGRALAKGEGIQKNSAQAAELLQKAADAGIPGAMDWIGFLYLTGEGLPKSEEKAAEWFKKGAEAGWPKSQLNYGLILRQGKSIELSNEKSLEWIQKAADGGFVEANAVFGRIYFNGDRLQPPVPEKSFPYIKVAAEAGDPVCQNILGLTYQNGLGNSAEHKAPEKAIDWFRKAAEQNDRKAQANLGKFLGAADPNSPNRAEAVKWTLIASERGEITAKKVLEEIQPTIPTEMLKQARAEANRFLLVQQVQAAARGAKKTSPNEPAATQPSATPSAPNGQPGT